MPVRARRRRRVLRAPTSEDGSEADTEINMLSPVRGYNKRTRRKTDPAFHRSIVRQAGSAGGKINCERFQATQAQNDTDSDSLASDSDSVESVSADSAGSSDDNASDSDSNDDAAAFASSGGTIGARTTVSPSTVQFDVSRLVTTRAVATRLPRQTKSRRQVKLPAAQESESSGGDDSLDSGVDSGVESGSEEDGLDDDDLVDEAEVGASAPATVSSPSTSQAIIPLSTMSRVTTETDAQAQSSIAEPFRGQSKINGGSSTAESSSSQNSGSSASPTATSTRAGDSTMMPASVDNQEVAPEAASEGTGGGGRQTADQNDDLHHLINLFNSAAPSSSIHLGVLLLCLAVFMFNQQ